MTDLLVELALYLKSNGVISGYGIDTYTDYEPDTPSSINVISEYQGTPSQDCVDAVNRSVQITCRASTATAARLKSWQIYNVLDKPDDRICTFASGRVCIIHPRQTPFKMRVDKSNRVTWGFNIGIITIKDN